RFSLSAGNDDFSSFLAFVHLLGLWSQIERESRALWKVSDEVCFQTHGLVEGNRFLGGLPVQDHWHRTLPGPTEHFFNHLLPQTGSSRAKFHEYIVHAPDSERGTQPWPVILRRGIAG